MQNRFLFLITIILLFTTGCTSDDLVLKGKDLQFSSQKWRLVQMTGSFVNSTTVGEAMDWQEYYIFNPDGSFIKSRERDGAVLEATGTFEMVEYDNDDADYLELLFETGGELAGGCYGFGRETLQYVAEDRLQSSWMACDGPGLFYEKEDD
ncbi:hypothetical protein [Maribacter flavus]|uniref:hypothetical protein n=1 Tax=Maribacter flavus TaxID=1658664 RepID=UPI001278DA67|nr:hypothetical protein [Maribacter flavus]MDC6404548.1 hypothetical protein [Maribacter sp. PR66]